LEDGANLSFGDIDLPVFNNRKLLNMQWIETTIDEVVTQICERFGYYFRFDVNGKASARLITNAAAVTHAYDDNTKLIEYTPDDKYSDFTNRVTVQGQELDFINVSYAEERITQLSGTLGWWGCKKDHKVWYSDDRSRRCIFPRMRAIETATSIPFKLAGKIKEHIRPCPDEWDNKYCTVTVEAPNLIGLLAASCLIAIIGWAIGNYAPPFGGMTVSIGRWVEKAGIIAAMMVLGSVANYQIEVWAQPLGKIRRSVQSTWNDEEHQSEINAIVEKVIKDPLCYSQPDCAIVAAFEGMVVQMQRKRLNITKIADIRDEDGDTISVIHPYSEEGLTLFITKLTRTLRKPDKASGDGYFTDSIEGWVCQ
jgi:hypothetical protein